MNNTMLKASVNTQIRVTDWSQTAVRKLHKRMDLKNRADKGQGAVEYLGVIAVAVIIILALMKTQVGATIRTGIMDQVKKITEKK
ncbi:hypothetical protein G5C51_24535 [Streptomyces sp. A7024]|uniref:Uncharacterized protein n=1 Tax=Streptomyces coryli TaxID=1128680 RepID=A0A6G4U4X8_9ACTN|nr:hypothetical protein [Streptomyces coryli]NGN67062.1 hypothetical protein [Streptomyces coryli]